MGCAAASSSNIRGAACSGRMAGRVACVRLSSSRAFRFCSGFGFLVGLVFGRRAVVVVHASRPGRLVAEQVAHALLDLLRVFALLQAPDHLFKLRPQVFAALLRHPAHEAAQGARVVLVQAGHLV